MRLAVSNIAWEKHDDPIILDILRKNGVNGIEIAPTKIWQEWEGASHKGAEEYRNNMLDRGFDLPAMQSILFGKPELQLFNPTSHAAFFRHIEFIADLANGFGSEVIVFGAPKNRKRGQLPYSESMEMAAEFFYRAGEICRKHGCCIGLEHNPVEYGCDFVTNALDAKELVEKVNNKGFKLHLDSAGLHLCGGDIAEVIRDACEFAHYHVSEPMLEPLFGGEVDQKKGIETLEAISYKHWVSIEMKKPASVEALERSVKVVSQIMFS